jgi:predicted alpha/beta-hydrolase family hydrolase
MFLIDAAKDALARVVLAHGAGAPMDHVWLNEMTALLADRRINVARFEFDFMAERRKSQKRRPAPKGEKLTPEYLAAIDALTTETDDDLPLFIGGKSMGGRVASLVADELFEAGRINGLICLGYPFHPSGKPDTLRTAHLLQFNCPALIVQGTRDALGSQDEVAGYGLDERIELAWMADGDHDLKPRKASGHTLERHMAAAADTVAAFARAPT